MSTENEFALSESPSAHDEDVHIDAGTEGGEPAAAEVEAEAEPTGGAPAGVAPEPAKGKTPTGVVKRFGELTAQRDTERAAREAAEQRVAAMEELLKAQGVELPAAQTASVQTFTQADIDAAAARQVAAQAFTARCNETFEAGVAAHGEGFQESLNALHGAGVMADMSLLDAAWETGAAPAVLYHLGQDLDEALRIAELPPVKRAIAIDRLARELQAPAVKAPPAPVSKAPPPISPVAGGRPKDSVDLTDPETPDDVWFAEMAKRDRARA